MPDPLAQAVIRCHCGRRRLPREDRAYLARCRKCHGGNIVFGTRVLAPGEQDERIMEREYG